MQGKSKRDDVVELRYQRYYRIATESKVGQIITNLWNNYIWHYSSKALTGSKKIIWTLTSLGVILLLPITMQAILEADAQMQNLSSQLDTAGQANYRPY
ncbi:unnamed protein product [Blepharisma stoltei]|uniref:Uncharacterized protein n=1 Tax=Blepharisma stoltei TaxID=1481888 RepID=A0AAU9IXB9_9CILI|nr:unnamed protein product [Blepharisma stoltei]